MTDATQSSLGEPRQRGVDGGLRGPEPRTEFTRCEIVPIARRLGVGDRRDERRESTRVGGRRTTSPDRTVDPARAPATRDPSGSGAAWVPMRTSGPAPLGGTTRSRRPELGRAAERMPGCAYAVAGDATSANRTSAAVASITLRCCTFTQVALSLRSPSVDPGSQLLEAPCDAGFRAVCARLVVDVARHLGRAVVLVGPNHRDRRADTRSRPRARARPPRRSANRADASARPPAAPCGRPRARARGPSSPGSISQPPQGESPPAPG